MKQGGKQAWKSIDILDIASIIQQENLKNEWMLHMTES